MKSEIRHAQQFYSNFQMLDLDINRIQHRHMRMRNFFLLLLTQLFLLSYFVITPWIN